MTPPPRGVQSAPGSGEGASTVTRRWKFRLPVRMRTAHSGCRAARISSSLRCPAGLTITVNPSTGYSTVCSSGALSRRTERQKVMRSMRKSRRCRMVRLNSLTVRLSRVSRLSSTNGEAATSATLRMLTL
ncbi:MAG: hypothetical protein BWZ02_01674 [Lentisphaerae bacterium ADurb.BinA184]|nr:MAG: hypothetical protein BWZ02_01674 [Lentisphaerae bacterium ADurb.BinA184]